ncbi:MAG TPA: hypothetical protein DIT48_07925 [Actinobacteria bacterium]|jgi:hypothetical protein|nr:hypothetical protein [Actinomycetota bacterium]HCP61583.1 hypothetical protein [Actinomycetota bacterium]
MSRRIDLSPLGMFAAAFLFLLGAATAVALAQFFTSPIAPWISTGYSLGAVVCAIVALSLRTRS